MVLCHRDRKGTKTLFKKSLQNLVTQIIKTHKFMINWNVLQALPAFPCAAHGQFSWERESYLMARLGTHLEGLRHSDHFFKSCFFVCFYFPLLRCYSTAILGSWRWARGGGGGVSTHCFCCLWMLITSSPQTQWLELDASTSWGETLQRISG